MADLLIHPRRSNRAKMLGRVEDTARAVARLGAHPHEVVGDLVGEALGWDLSPEEADLAARAYDAERSKRLADE